MKVALFIVLLVVGTAVAVLLVKLGGAQPDEASPLSAPEMQFQAPLAEPPPQESPLPPDAPDTMTISSPAFSHNAPIPSEFTCDGKDVNPPLTIDGVPEGAKSLALIMDDPDAPTGTWVHWTVWNISPSIKEIPEKSVPAGAAQGVTSFGRPGYGGPCPPSGTHRYFFKLYALDSVLSLNPNATKENLEAAMAGHIMAQAELVGLYSAQ